MGEHRTNPTAIAAKNGELLHKKKSMSKRERERELELMIMREIERRTGIYTILWQARRDSNAAD